MLQDKRLSMQYMYKRHAHTNKWSQELANVNTISCTQNIKCYHLKGLSTQMMLNSLARSKITANHQILYIGSKQCACVCACVCCGVCRVCIICTYHPLDARLDWVQTLSSCFFKFFLISCTGCNYEIRELPTKQWHMKQQLTQCVCKQFSPCGVTTEWKFLKQFPLKWGQGPRK